MHVLRLMEFLLVLRLRHGYRVIIERVFALQSRVIKLVTWMMMLALIYELVHILLLVMLLSWLIISIILLTSIVSLLSLIWQRSCNRLLLYLIAVVVLLLHLLLLQLLLLVKLLLLLMLLQNELFLIFPPNFKAQNLLVVDLISRCLEEALVVHTWHAIIRVVVTRVGLLNCAKSLSLMHTTSDLSEHVRKQYSSSILLHPIPLYLLECQRLVLITLSSSWSRDVGKRLHLGFGWHSLLNCVNFIDELFERQKLVLRRCWHLYRVSTCLVIARSSWRLLILKRSFRGLTRTLYTLVNLLQLLLLYLLLLLLLMKRLVVMWTFCWLTISSVIIAILLLSSNVLSMCTLLAIGTIGHISLLIVSVWIACRGLVRPFGRRCLSVLLIVLLSLLMLLLTVL